MRYLRFASVALLMLFPLAFGQQDPDDPGMQDSIIIGPIAPFDSSDEYQYSFVQVFAVCDDSVAFYNLPITWQAPLGGVSFGSGNMYFYPLTEWARTYDSLLTEEHYVRNVGLVMLDTTTRPCLNTYGQRLHIISFRMIIAPNAPPQTIVLDTCWDDRGGSSLLGLINGINEITPGILKQEVLLRSPTGVNESPVPLQFSISQNYPNPFNARTTISYSLSSPGHLTLEIYDISGRMVELLDEGLKPAGEHRVTWDASAFSSGLYFARLTAGERAETVKLLLLR